MTDSTVSITFSIFSTFIEKLLSSNRVLILNFKFDKSVFLNQNVCKYTYVYIEMLFKYFITFFTSVSIAQGQAVVAHPFIKNLGNILYNMCMHKLAAEEQLIECKKTFASANGKYHKRLSHVLFPIHKKVVKFAEI